MRQTNKDGEEREPLTKGPNIKGGERNVWPVASLWGRESMRKEALEMKNKNEEDEKEEVNRQKKGTSQLLWREARLRNGSFQGQRVKGSNHPLLICSQDGPGRSSPGCPWRWPERFWDSVTWDEPWGPGKRVLPLCPRYHFLVQVCSALPSVDQGWEREPDWIISSYHGVRRSGVGNLGMMSRPTKARATHFLSLNLIFPCCKWRLMLFLEVLWMDWSGRKTSANTKHCRHFRSYYDQICYLRTLHETSGHLHIKLKGKSVFIA